MSPLSYLAQSGKGVSICTPRDRMDTRETMSPALGGTMTQDRRATCKVLSMFTKLDPSNKTVEDWRTETCNASGSLRSTGIQAQLELAVRTYRAIHKRPRRRLLEQSLQT